jgi:hypothetical protein
LRTLLMANPEKFGSRERFSHKPNQAGKQAQASFLKIY